MTTPDELERAVERLTALATDLDYAAMPTKPHVVTLCGSYAADARDDLRLLLSERAELLAAVERMRQLLKTIRDYVSDTVEGRITQTPTLTAMAREDLARIDAALTTGEGK